jgi:BirA family biotin operon repressor/biotin-[acetyl-CoA-carboxylase] ligase
MTLVLKPAELLTDASLLTQLTAASLVNALSETASLEIKWPNDVLLNRKKIAGILTEAEFSGSKLSGIIIGMGINTNIEKKDIPQDIMDKATSLRIETNETINPNSLLQSFFKHFENYYDAFTQNKQYEPFLEVCRKHSALIDRTMWLHDGNKRRQIFVETIDTNGGLVIKDCLTQKRETLTSTHFSIRGENGYI